MAVYTPPKPPPTMTIRVRFWFVIDSSPARQLCQVPAEPARPLSCSRRSLADLDEVRWHSWEDRIETRWPPGLDHRTHDALNIMPRQSLPSMERDVRFGKIAPSSAP